VEIHGRTPEAARRVQQVDVRKPAAWSLEAVKQEARVDERGIERLAVVGDKNAGRAHECGEFLQQQPLGGKAGEYKLAHPEYRAVEPPASDEKRVRARASGETGRLEIEEQQPAARGVCSAGPAHEQAETWPPAVIRRQAIGHRDASKPEPGVIRPIDNEIAAVPPFATQRFSDVIVMSRLKPAPTLLIVVKSLLIVVGAGFSRLYAHDAPEAFGEIHATPASRRPVD